MLSYLDIARRAMARQTATVAADPPEPDRRRPTPAPPAALAFDRNDPWRKMRAAATLADNDEELDPADLTPCPNCGRLELWWPVVGPARCMQCDPPLAALRFWERSQELGRRRRT